MKLKQFMKKKLHEKKFQITKKRWLELLWKRIELKENLECEKECEEKCEENIEMVIEKECENEIENDIDIDITITIEKNENEKEIVEINNF